MEDAGRKKVDFGGGGKSIPTILHKMAAHLLWLLTAWPLGKFGGQCVAHYIDKGGRGREMASEGRGSANGKSCNGRKGGQIRRSARRANFGWNSPPGQPSLLPARRGHGQRGSILFSLGKGMKEKKRGRREEGTLTNWILVWVVIVGLWKWRRQWRSKRLIIIYINTMRLLWSFCHLLRKNNRNFFIILSFGQRANPSPIPYYFLCSPLPCCH
jgi:hypothetical protein